jgi:ribonuclease D
MPGAVVRKQGEVLLDLVAACEALADAELPHPLAGPLDASQRDTLKRLKRAAADLARQWQVDPEALLPSRDYELIVRLGSGESVDPPPSWSGWRRELLIEPLLELARGGI